MLSRRREGERREYHKAINDSSQYHIAEGRIRELQRDFWSAMICIIIILGFVSSCPLWKQREQSPEDRSLQLISGGPLTAPSTNVRFSLKPTWTIRINSWMNCSELLWMLLSSIFYLSYKSAKKSSGMANGHFCIGDEEWHHSSICGVSMEVSSPAACPDWWIPKEKVLIMMKHFWLWTPQSSNVHSFPEHLK